MANIPHNGGTSIVVERTPLEARLEADEARLTADEARLALDEETNTLLFDWEELSSDFDDDDDEDEGKIFFYFKLDFSTLLLGL